MEVDQVSDHKSDIFHHWMAAHACLKDEFTEEGEKYYNLMRWLISKIFNKKQRFTSNRQEMEKGSNLN